MISKTNNFLNLEEIITSPFSSSKWLYIYIYIYIKENLLFFISFEIKIMYWKKYLIIYIIWQNILVDKWYFFINI
ncbi:MAG: hypothetical protein N7Q72_05140, partial [Spiroplasma sp. Tabriz.8]|nr:hypothetical protein [Spiroplasma sp. Tabriz.8]